PTYLVLVHRESGPAIRPSQALPAGIALEFPLVEFLPALLAGRCAQNWPQCLCLLQVIICDHVFYGSLRFTAAFRAAPPTTSLASTSAILYSAFTLRPVSGAVEAIRIGNAPDLAPGAASQRKTKSRLSAGTTMDGH